MLSVVNRIAGIIIFLIFTASATLSFGQDSSNGMVGIGQWRMHIPYNKAISVTEGNGKVFCASRYGLFSYDKNDGSLERYSRVSGLSDFEISSVKYNSSIGVLMIAYANSNIDLLYNDNTIVNLSDIQRNNIVGNKSINDIYFLNHYAYLSCGFGIVVVDLNKKEIKDTYYIGPNGTTININSFTSDGTFFYAATNNGIYKASLNDPQIFNYSSWSKDTTIPNHNGAFTSIAYFSNKLFTVNANVRGGNDTLMYNDGTVWTGFPDSNLVDYDMKVSANNNHLVMKLSYTMYAYDVSLQRTHLMYWWIYPNMQPVDGFVDDNNIFWIADNNNGLIRFALPYDFSLHTPNGPKSQASYAMQCMDDDLWVASGTIIGTSAAYSQNGTYLFSNEEWKTLDRNNDHGYDTLGYHDVVCIAVDPKDSKHAFAGTWGSGLLEYRDNGVTNVYNTSNSTLQIISLSSGTFRPIQVGGVAFDSDNNLWVTNTLNSTPLSVRKTDGSWQSFVIPSQFANTFIYNIIVDDFNQKWMVSPGTGIGVFAENDISNPNDNSFKLLTAAVGNGNLPSINVYSIAKDKDGAIWIGSDQGVAVIYNPGNVFSGGNYDAQQILIQQDGHTQYLLQTEYVLAIAVDGANRKWFGTVSGGVFLMSADGTQLLQHFTVDNSPLLSNYVRCISINDNTGEVFFGTENGIVSYRSDATVGDDKTCGNTLVFPNPIKHDYSGPIAIKGLVNNADVKITDLAGALVYHTKANGGEAIWYGNNFKGDRVHTGVYFVYATNEDGSGTCVTKLLFTH